MSGFSIIHDLFSLLAVIPTVMMLLFSTLCFLSVAVDHSLAPVYSFQLQLILSKMNSSLKLVLSFLQLCTTARLTHIVDVLGAVFLSYVTLCSVEIVLKSN